MTISEDPDDMGSAYHRMALCADRTQQTDRRGWTDAQWVADARRVMDLPDGSAFSLLNGHILALLGEVARWERIAGEARERAQEMEIRYDQLTCVVQRLQQEHQSQE